MDNPVLSLQNISDIESKILSNQEDFSDYNNLDFFISATGGPANYLKNIATANGFSDFREYIRVKNEMAVGRKMQISTVSGSVLGAIQYLKNYAKNNNFYV